MAKAGKVALGCVVIGTRERILACTIRTDAVARQADETFDAISDAKPDAAMISIAERIIEQRRGPSTPASSSTATRRR